MTLSYDRRVAARPAPDQDDRQPYYVEVKVGVAVLASNKEEAKQIALQKTFTTLGLTMEPEAQARRASKLSDFPRDWHSGTFVTDKSREMIELKDYFTDK
jgi:hypothetical protein